MTPKLFDWLANVKPITRLKPISQRPVTLDRQLWDLPVDRPSPTGTSRTDQLARYLIERPWIDVTAIELERFGRQAWRTRLSEARTRYSMVITNKLRRRPDGSVESSYRYEPGGRHE